MTVHAILLGFVVSTLLAALAHLWRGGNLGRLLFFIFISWIGFWCGHVIGKSLNWTFFKTGPLYLGTAILLSIVLLAIVQLFTPQTE